jgi:hypothetical protein
VPLSQCRQITAVTGFFFHDRHDWLLWLLIIVTLDSLRVLQLSLAWAYRQAATASGIKRLSNGVSSLLPIYGQGKVVGSVSPSSMFLDGPFLISGHHRQIFLNVYSLWRGLVGRLISAVLINGGFARPLRYLGSTLKVFFGKGRLF